MKVCSIWPFAQISTDFYYLGIWQCARSFDAALFKELASITIREMWGLESRSRTSRSRSWSRLLWQSLGLVSKFEPGLSLGGYGLEYITVCYVVSKKINAKYWWKCEWMKHYTLKPRNLLDALFTLSGFIEWNLLMLTKSCFWQLSRRFDLNLWFLWFYFLHV